MSQKIYWSKKKKTDQINCHLLYSYLIGPMVSFLTFNSSLIHFVLINQSMSSENDPVMWQRAKKKSEFDHFDLITARFWWTWEQTTSVLKMKMEHWSVSSANSPNRHGERERPEEQRTPPPLCPHIPPSAKEWKKGGREDEHHSLIWIVTPLCEQLEWLLCALMPVCHRKPKAWRPLALLRGAQRSKHETWQHPECPRLVQHTKHNMYYDMCIRGTLTCTHIPMRASNTSSMHIPLSA